MQLRKQKNEWIYFIVLYDDFWILWIDVISPKSTSKNSYFIFITRKYYIFLERIMKINWVTTLREYIKWLYWPHCEKITQELCSWYQEKCRYYEDT
jgi:hypothetical protein